jgi:hypothetical protein
MDREFFFVFYIEYNLSTSPHSQAYSTKSVCNSNFLAFLDSTLKVNEHYNADE